MAALVSYGSSDEEENNTGFKTPPLASTIPPGPILGPAAPLRNGESTPQSPYSSNRALLRDLTLPTIPNYDIPPSPPASPVSSKKLQTFLDLKKQGVHFNARLSNSSALKNPSLMEKLLEFSSISQPYSTTLPKELWNPGGFPEPAYKEGLSKSQQQILKQREDEKLKGGRESVAFVPAAASGEPSRGGTPKIGQKSAAERIMAGLDRGKSQSPQVGAKRKTRFEN